MNSRVLEGAKIVVFSTLESVRAQSFAQLTVAGWQAAIEIPETLEELTKTLQENLENALVLVLESDASSAERACSLGLSIGLDPSQIVIGCVRNSFVHRLIARKGVGSFPFGVEATALGPKVSIDGLVQAALDQWNAYVEFALDREISSALDSGTLSLLSDRVPGLSVPVLKERAHLAFALANTFSSSFAFRKRTIKLALFSEVTRLDSWSTLVSTWRNLWPLKSLLAACESLSRTVTLSGVPVIYKDAPHEVVILSIVQMFQAGGKESKAVFEKKIEEMTFNLPLQLKLRIRTSVAAAFRHTFGEQRDVA